MNKFLRKKAATDPLAIPKFIWSGISNVGDSIGGLISKGGEAVFDLAKEHAKASTVALAMSAPVTALALSYLVARMRSPEAVAKNAHQYALNSLIETSLDTSKKDLEQLLANKKLKSNAKFHDQYL